MLTYFPSPSQAVFHLGPIPLRMYAVCIILGVLVAVKVGERRAVARGFPPGTVADVATVAVPAGLVGARLYHVITSPRAYFGKGGHPIEVLYIWKGGLGIWGGVAAGALAAWFVCRRRGISFAPFADALGPCVALAQAVGRFGNYFNQELYGRPTNVPWGLRIDPANRPDATPTRAFYQPTFLYEALWDVGVFGLCVWAEKRFRLGSGRVMALYIAAYCVGRGWIEALRVDTAKHILGLRLNDWTSIIVFTLAVTYLVVMRGRDRAPAVGLDSGADDIGPRAAADSP